MPRLIRNDRLAASATHDGAAMWARRQKNEMATVARRLGGPGGVVIHSGVTAVGVNGGRENNLQRTWPIIPAQFVLTTLGTFSMASEPPHVWRCSAKRSGCSHVLSLAADFPSLACPCARDRASDVWGSRIPAPAWKLLGTARPRGLNGLAVAMTSGP